MRRGAPLATVAAVLLAGLMLVSISVSSASTRTVAGSTGTKFAVVEPGIFPFYAPFKGAVAAAAKNFHITPVPLIGAPQSYDQSLENAVVDGFVADGVNGIAIQPVDIGGTNATIRSLVKDGINVVAYAACDETKSAGAAVCIEASLYADAYDATIALIKKMGYKGNIVHLAGELAGSVTSPRIQGVDAAIKLYPHVHLLETIANIDTPTLAPPAVATLLAAHKNQINGVVATADNPSDAWAKAMETQNDKSIPSILTDIDPTIVGAVEKGYATGTMASNAYGQAYLSVYSLKLLSEGCHYTGPFVFNIPYIFVGASGIGTIYQTLAATATKIGTTWKSRYWSCP
jgi:ABC-type sugar transport system substrate-binding protein